LADVRQRGAAPAILLAAGLALLVLAWVFGNPPGAAPDERAHYVRALGAGGLELIGERFVPTEAQRRAFVEQGKSGGPQIEGSGLATVLWAAKQTRTFAVPPALSVVAFGCNDRRPAVSAACLEDRQAGRPVSRLPTYTGTYPPFAYVLPGVAMRLQDAPEPALRAGRLVSAALCIMLLSAAVALTWVPAGGGVVLAALGLAVTPMVVFCASTLNASGPEIAGSLCFVAAGLRLRRPGAGPGTWAALAAGGGALVLARSLGPALLVVMAATLLVLPAAERGVRPRPPAAALALLLAAFAAGLWWVVAQEPHGVEGGPGLRDALAQTLHDLDDLAGHAVGNFGALDTRLPTALYVLWGLAALALAGSAAVLGSGRERAGLALTGAVALAVTVAVSVFQLRTGYGAQGRHVLPVLVLVALWAGEVLRRHATGHRWALPVAGVAALFAGGQALAWWTNARRAAVGTDGPWWFAGAAEWSPPGGWGPWAVLAAAGALLALAGGLLAAQRSDRSRSRSMPPSSASAAT
jgi:hypothetical protein